MCYVIPSLVKCPCVVPGNSWRDGRPGAPGDRQGSFGVYEIRKVSPRIPHKGFPRRYTTRDPHDIPQGSPRVQNPRRAGDPLGYLLVAPPRDPQPLTPRPGVQSLWSAVKNRSGKDSTYRNECGQARMCYLIRSPVCGPWVVLVLGWSSSCLGCPSGMILECFLGYPSRDHLKYETHKVSPRIPCKGIPWRYTPGDLRGSPMIRHHRKSYIK